MRNKYPGMCYRCGKSVGVGQGHFEKVIGNGWRVQHADCAILHRKEVNRKEWEEENTSEGKQE